MNTPVFAGALKVDMIKSAINYHLCVLLISAGSACVSFAGDSILNVNFDSRNTGLYSDDMVHQDWGTVEWASLQDRASIVRDADSAHGNVLKIAYPKGSVGPNEGGGQFVVSLPPSEEMWLSYYVKFDEGFDFRRGGKLPGLTSGGSRFTGGRIPEEGEGWSARLMWRENGDAFVYLYYVDMSGMWGDNLPLNRSFKPGTWHRITQRIKLNAGDDADGILDVWIDGEKALSRSDIRYRIGDKGIIDSMYFSTFHGGSTEDWAPHVDSFAFFDHFVVSREPLIPER